MKTLEFESFSINPRCTHTRACEELAYADIFVA
jgi:hypothetical protein